MKTNGQEERLLMRLLKLFDAIVGNGRIRNTLIVTFHDSKGDATDAANIHLRLLASFLAAGSRPLIWKPEPSVPQLAHAQSLIARLSELSHQRLLSRDRSFVRMRVVINARRRRPKTGQQRRSRRIADRRRAVSVGKRHAHFSESIQIRSLRLRIPPQMPDPVIQIVDRNKQHIRPLLIIRAKLRNGQHHRNQHHRTNQSHDSPCTLGQSVVEISANGLGLSDTRVLQTRIRPDEPVTTQLVRVSVEHWGDRTARRCLWHSGHKE